MTRTTIAAMAAASVALSLCACGGGGSSAVQSVNPGSHHSPSPSPSPSATPGGSSVKHVVIIEMENRSFDSYFGTYPGVNGIPSNPNCNPDPQSGQCLLPTHNPNPVNYGGPHDPGSMNTDIDGGKLDGFIIAAETQPHKIDPQPDDVMGYHTCADIPVYCQYAAGGTLADNHFAATLAWSVMAHLYLVSGWSAECTSDDPMSCVTSNNVNYTQDKYSWTDITWILHSHGVSWGYFVYGKVPIPPSGPRDTGGDDEDPGPITFLRPSAWNPLPGFEDVRSDGEMNNVQPGANFSALAASGTLPAVSWLIPPFELSDHPPAPITKGQKWAQHQINDILNGPDASSTLILLTWDEWGGFYDHVVPPVVDAGGYGFRTPLILIGPMVKKGYIDHQLLTSDAYLKLIEDLFLGSARLDANDGRPDSRPDVRERAPGLGDLRFDLTR